MKMDKLQFTFAIKKSPVDEKSSIYCVTHVTTLDGIVYKIPDEMNSISFHPLLWETPEAKKVKFFEEKKPIQKGMD